MNHGVRILRWPLFVLGMLLVACSRAPAERPGMVYVPPGEFLMGSAASDPDVYDWEKPHEQPQHPVYLDGYYIDVHEVTNAEFERFDPTHRRNQTQSPCDDCPVTNVSWFAAQAYCAAQKPPKRLPTEAEWEKAAKAGQPVWKPRPFDAYVWYSGNSITRAQPVGQKRPNPLGLYDMLGNVREWTADWYDPDYYRQRNLLRARVTAAHVGKAVVFFAAEETPTTGAVLPIDGGLPGAFPR